MVTPKADAGGNTRLSPDDRAMLESIARWLGERRLSVPAIVLLESTKPLNFIGSQLLFFFEPIVKAVVQGRNYTRFASIMEDRENVEEFLQLIETIDQEDKGSPEEENR